jgi:UDP-N-acetylmuramate dehydrogenase
MNSITGIQTKEKLKEFFKGKVKVKEPLALHTYMKIGGPVDFFLNPSDIDDLKAAVEYLTTNKIPFKVIGKGTNLLVSDEELPMAAIELSSDYFKHIEKQETSVYARAGASLAGFVNFTKQNSLSGGEFLAGIPGSIGGAVCMNAGARDITQAGQGRMRCVADIVNKVEVLTRNNKIKTLKKQEIEFSYRSSNLADKIIIGAWFGLELKAQQFISRDIAQYLNNKMMTQELSMPNAGCIFKNPKASKMSAGALIDQANMKGFSIGDAAVSSIHANFIINRGKASFDQVVALMKQVQEKVKIQYSVDLEPEVEIWDKQGVK